MNRGENVKENIISYSPSALTDASMYHPKPQNRFNSFPITFYFIKLILKIPEEKCLLTLIIKYGFISFGRHLISKRYFQDQQE